MSISSHHHDSVGHLRCSPHRRSTYALVPVGTLQPAASFLQSGVDLVGMGPDDGVRTIWCSIEDLTGEGSQAWRRSGRAPCCVRSAYGWSGCWHRSTPTTTVSPPPTRSPRTWPTAPTGGPARRTGGG